MARKSNGLPIMILPRLGYLTLWLAAIALLTVVAAIWELEITPLGW